MKREGEARKKEGRSREEGGKSRRSAGEGRKEEREKEEKRERKKGRGGKGARDEKNGKYADVDCNLAFPFCSLRRLPAILLPPSPCFVFRREKPPSVRTAPPEKILGRQRMAWTTALLSFLGFTVFQDYDSLPTIRANRTLHPHSGSSENLSLSPPGRNQLFKAMAPRLWWLAALGSATPPTRSRSGSCSPTQSTGLATLQAQSLRAEIVCPCRNCCVKDFAYRRFEHLWEVTGV